MLGHLAATYEEDDALLAVLGTGHAAGALFAHEALASNRSPADVATAIGRYGIAGGDPTEVIGLADVPYIGGELGPALAVGQAIAAAQPGRLVVSIVGDGECETPVALAGLAHREAVLGGTPGRWLGVVNANGSRMGGTAGFSPERLRSVGEALGYAVMVSGEDSHVAAKAAEESIALAVAGKAALWISVTEKGWPAPCGIASPSFRGHHAHKVQGVDVTDSATLAQVADWLCQEAAAAFDDDGVPFPKLVRLARRVTFRLPTAPAVAGPRRAIPDSQQLGWRSPTASVDLLLARRRVTVFSPDEAASNRLLACVRDGLTIEVLAEEVCSAWTWGSVEAGKPAVFATYEAFAPLAASQIAQYAKMVSARPPAGRPPFLVLLSSLGWANSPTHQNTDMVATAAARLAAGVRLLFPLGASSAVRRVGHLLDHVADAVAVVLTSKHDVLDIPDPGSPLVAISLDSRAPDAVIIALGDVCVTEAVAAAALASTAGVVVRVVAVVDVALALHRAWSIPGSGDVPVVAVVCCAPVFVEGILWRLIGAPHPVAGYCERSGATPWETLSRNGMDRLSLLRELSRFPSLADRLGASASLEQRHPSTVLPRIDVTSITTQPVGVRETPRGP